MTAAPRDSAGLILLREGPDEPEILMLKRPASMAFAGGVWVFPGGKTNSGETHIAAARREATEETGLTPPGEGKLLWYSHWITPIAAPLRFSTHFYLGLYTRNEALVPDSREVDDIGWFRVSDGLSHVPLMFPTIMTLKQFAGRTVANILSLARNAPPPRPICPEIFVENGEAFVRVPEHAGLGQTRFRRADLDGLLSEDLVFEQKA